MTIFINHDNCYTFNRFFKNCGGSLRREMPFIFYADLAFRKSLPHDIALFTDLERLDEAGIELAIAAENQLRAAGVRILNAPSQVLRRYDLLRKLNNEGINEFRAYRLHEDRTQLRYPVFLRLEREHQGSLSALLNTPQEVEKAIEQACLRGMSKDNLLLVEYCEVRDEDGLFRKYAAFLVGESCFARHIVAGRDWMSKNPDRVYENDPACALQENEYLKQFPHEDEVRKLFQSAGIDYGRIDYSLKNGKIVVWEINTNPNIIPDGTFAPERQAGQEQVHQNVYEALSKLISPSAPNGKKIPFIVPHALKQRLHINNIENVVHPIKRLLRPFEMKRVKRIFKHRVLKKIGFYKIPAH
jgi:hypothetical protein